MKYLVLIFTFLPMVGAYYGGKIFVFLPLIFSSIFMLILSVKKSKISIFYLSPKYYFIIILLALITLYQYLIGIGIPQGGVIILFIQVFIFYQILMLSKTTALQNFTNVIVTVYFVQIIYLYFELILRANGYEFIFLELFDKQHPFMKGFKDYNTAPKILTEIIGIRGLNSSMLGSQIASIFTLVSTILFLMLKQTYKDKKLFYNFLFFASLILYLLSMTQTSNVIIIIIIIFSLILRFKILFFKRNFFYTMLGLAAVFYIAISNGISFKQIIFFKTYTSEDFEIYLNLFLNPLNEYLDLTIHEILFGIGRAQWIYDASTDLGFFAILFRVGIIFFIIINLSLIIFIYDKYKYYKFLNKVNLEQSFFCLFNILAVIIYFFSLIHYTNVIELGARELFAFHIASLLSLNSKKNHSINNR